MGGIPPAMGIPPYWGHTVPPHGGILYPHMGVYPDVGVYPHTVMGVNPQYGQPSIWLHTHSMGPVATTSRLLHREQLPVHQTESYSRS